MHLESEVDSRRITMGQGEEFPATRVWAETTHEPNWRADRTAAKTLWTSHWSDAMNQACLMSVGSHERSHLCDSHREEVASLVTHALGVLFAVASLVVMAVLAVDDALEILAAMVFGVSLVALYTCSTIYHIITSPQWKARLQTLDHVCIYLLIAGTYTPFTLLTLRGPWGWSLLALVWMMALAGTLMKTIRRGRLDSRVSTALYLLMGWLIVVAAGPLLERMPAAGVGWLVAGGLSYTLGVVFFAWRSIPYNHAIWHLFVLAGSTCHVCAACLFVFR